MPQKHSKNNGSSTYGVFSYGERKRCEFMSSIDERTGADAQLPFGWCALSLQPAKDPVCTPSGHIYSRESLLEHMVSKGDELKAARAKWDADRAREAREAGQQRNEDDRQLLLEFRQITLVKLARNGIRYCITGKSMKRLVGVGGANEWLAC